MAPPLTRRALGATLLLLTLAATPMLAYPNGISLGCTDPNHGDPVTAGDASVTIKFQTLAGADTTNYVPGRKYNVVLSRATAFLGFMVQGLMGTNTVAMGTGVKGSFDTSSLYNQHTCDGTAQGAASHNSGANKTTMTLPWTAPAVGTGQITFRAVVVVVKAEWYNAIFSATISEATRTPSPTTTPTPVPPPVPAPVPVPAAPVPVAPVPAPVAAPVPVAPAAPPAGESGQGGMHRVPMGGLLLALLSAVVCAVLLL